MASFIHNITTAVPGHAYRQDFLRDKMKEYISGDRATRRIIHRIYSQSGIDKRHTIVNDFNANGDARFYFRKDGTLNVPTTEDRNKLYTRYAKKLFVEVGRSLLADHPTLNAEDITHVITVSCTGFFAPGPDYEIVNQLGLAPSTQRFHLGFMGCYAAFPALKMAESFCTSDKNAVVMVICLELCSLHFQNSERTDNLISASVFADGAAGALVSSRAPESGKTVIQLDRFATSIAKHSEQDMAWTIGDTGFDMILSSYVPEIIESNLRSSIQPLLESYDIGVPQIRHWAIHPGGRAILDKVEKNLELKSEQLASSRAVLAEYGNMSSATILFVLKHLAEQPTADESEQILAMAFGPGLTIESGLFAKRQV
ncbi:MAG: 3-oxoacyl-[acyl-carrier-protein] synthase III C-terminal domain-containing protein [Balneolaceae bacterium]|nr:3-oxoacyl-[acyl-carrier-protein] synthase III C-terminal domain-containing protein [Balneolaceae bacterium]